MVYESRRRRVHALVATVVMGAWVVAARTGPGARADIERPEDEIAANSDAIIAGEVTGIGDPKCLPPGSEEEDFQPVRIKVIDVLKGEFPGPMITVYYQISGVGGLEAREDGCRRLSSKLVHQGTRVKVALSAIKDREKTEFHATDGGFWLDTPEKRRDGDDHGKASPEPTNPPDPSKPPKH